MNFEVNGKNTNCSLMNTLVERYDQLEEDLFNYGPSEESLYQISVCLSLLDDVLQQEVDANDNAKIAALQNYRNHLVQQNQAVQNCLSNRQMRMPQSMEINNSDVPSNVVNDFKTDPKIAGFQDVAGLTDVKKELMSSIILRLHQPQLFKHFRSCKSILLYGPPGTGKTLLAHALAAEMKADLYTVSASDIMSSYIGQSEQNLKQIFDAVLKATSYTVLFIDEIDGLCRARDDRDTDASRRFKTEMMCQLNQLDNSEVQTIYFVCATNCPWDLDVAFLRRFHRKLYVPLPNYVEIFEFLRFFSKDTPLIKTTSYWKSAINSLHGYSGADIANVVRYALNLPLKELLDVKSWTMVDGKYRPTYACPTATALSKTIECTVDKLPKNTVEARDPNFVDLLTAIHTIPKSTTEQQLNRYINYI